MKTVIKKEELATVAQNLFKDKGFAATSMRDLANEADIGLATIYNYVKSKEDILQGICFKVADDFLSIMEDNKKGSLQQQLDFAIKSHVAVMIDNIEASAVFMQEWKHLTEPYLSEFLAMRDTYEKYFIKIIRKGVKEGAFQKMKPKFAAITILSALNGIYDWYKPNGKMSAKEVGENLSDLLIKGLII